jgi:hypothetical protein
LLILTLIIANGAIEDSDQLNLAIALSLQTNDVSILSIDDTFSANSQPETMQPQQQNDEKHLLDESDKNQVEPEEQPSKGSQSGIYGAQIDN